MGMPWDPRRGRRIEEHIALLRTLWRASEPVEFHGEFHDFAGSIDRSRCLRSVPSPSAIGGHSDAALGPSSVDRRRLDRGADSGGCPRNPGDHFSRGDRAVWPTDPSTHRIVAAMRPAADVPLVDWPRHMPRPGVHHLQLDLASIPVHGRPEHLRQLAAELLPHAEPSRERRSRSPLRTLPALTPERLPAREGVGQRRRAVQAAPRVETPPVPGGCATSFAYQNDSLALGEVPPAVPAFIDVDIAERHDVTTVAILALLCGSTPHRGRGLRRRGRSCGPRSDARSGRSSAARCRRRSAGLLGSAPVPTSVLTSGSRRDRPGSRGSGIEGLGVAAG